MEVSRSIPRSLLYVALRCTMHPRSTRWQRDMTQLQDLLRALHAYPPAHRPQVCHHHAQTSDAFGEGSNRNVQLESPFPFASSPSTVSQALRLKAPWHLSRIGGRVGSGEVGSVRLFFALLGWLMISIWAISVSGARDPHHIRPDVTSPL
jgi:hypothetical protein